MWPLYRNEEINEKMDIETELLYALRMMVAALIGGLIGWERERHAGGAGIRTYMAIAIGACAFCLISVHVANDPTRIAAQVVSGIGFIGAGVIFQDKGGIVGLTTAATLWATAAVGMASAFGMYVLAIVTGGIIFTTLALHHLPGWKGLSQKPGNQDDHE
ncbi:MAG: MgtC/SapB family protein [Methylococcaceae bacterium]|nr:MgtC/SapB family protein [Methylococcaceae bacterium]